MCVIKNIKIVIKDRKNARDSLWEIPIKTTTIKHVTSKTLMSKVQMDLAIIINLS